MGASAPTAPIYGSYAYEYWALLIYLTCVWNVGQLIINISIKWWGCCYEVGMAEFACIAMRGFNVCHDLDVHFFAIWPSLYPFIDFLYEELECWSDS